MYKHILIAVLPFLPAAAVAAGAEGNLGSDRAGRREADAIARSEQGERMRHLAGERGCTVCHREAPSPREPGGAAPLAPSWREIAARYRGDPGAQRRLTRTIMQGADPSERHWKDRLDFNSMQGNEARVSPDEARALARWILSSPPARR